MTISSHTRHIRYARAAAVIAALLLETAPAAAIDLKIATIAPDGTAWMQEMREGANEIARRTERRVTFKFYPGGVMGNDKSVLRKIRAGQLHGGALAGGALTEISPDNQIYNLPMMFRSYEEADYVRARMDDILLKGLEKRGFVTFGIAEGGFAYIMSHDPIRHIDDLKAHKVWIPEGDVVSRTVFEAMDISPIQLPVTDVLTGLQTGLITAVGASPTGTIALQWHTKVRYLTDTPLMYLYGALTIRRNAFEKIAPADQMLVREVMGRVFTRLNHQNRIDNENAKGALRTQGIEFVSLEPAELAKLQANADRAIERLGEMKVYTPAMLKVLRGHLDAYRNHAVKATSSKP